MQILAPPKPNAKPAGADGTKNTPKGSLLCGLDAINHIMVNQGRMPISRDLLDDLADNVATLEAIVSPGTSESMPHAEGNYHITVMTIALKQLTDLAVEIWDPGQNDLTKPPVAFVRGNGAHWQAFVQEPNGWYIRDKKSFQVRYLKNFLTVSCRHGMVLALRRKPSKPSGDVDWGNSTPNRKCLHHEVAGSQTHPPTGDISSSSGGHNVIPDDDEDEQA